MNYNKNTSEKTAGVIRYSCGILFSLFTFCYLYFLQGEILAQAQYVFSNGVTKYSILIGAIIITFVLLCLQWLMALITRLPAALHALTYIPSVLALTILTDVNQEVMAHFSFGSWIWIAPLILVVYAAAVILIQKFYENGDIVLNYNIRSMIYPNYVILFVAFIFVGAVPQTSDVYHFELKTERLILEGEYEEASRVGEKSLRTSRRLTELRMYALSMLDQLPERIFDYPQYYGKKGLLILNDTSSSNRMKSRRICAHLGAICGDNIKSADTYLSILVNTDTLRNQHNVDYYLCNLLLDKKLDKFHEGLLLYYNLSDTLTNPYDSLPRAYREAMLVMGDNQEAITGKIIINGDSIATLHDTAMVAQFREYNSLKNGISNETARINKAHREYGKTFWWYYDFSDKAIGELEKK